MAISSHQFKLHFNIRRFYQGDRFGLAENETEKIRLPGDFAESIKTLVLKFLARQFSR